jgi:amidase
MTGIADELAMRKLTGVGSLIAARDLTSREITEAQLKRIAALDHRLRSYAQVLESTALAQADAADEEIASGRLRGPLHGVPIAVKDLCWIKDVPAAAGTVVYKDFVPSEDSTVVHRLKEAGAVLIGKTQLTEGAYSDYHPSVQPVVNPWNPEYWAGISSSGSAVATAAGLCYGAIASDTGGSIRWPSAANGVTGIKPTWGRVSRHGVFELAASLDHVGVIARSVADAAVILSVIAGNDPKDPTTATIAVPNYLNEVSPQAKGLRIGIDPRWNSEGVEDETQTALSSAVETFSSLDAEIIEIEFPDVTQIIRDWVPNCAVEAAVAHEAAYLSQKEMYGPILASVIEAGKSLSGTDYQKFLMRRGIFRGLVESLFSSVDVVMTPVQPFAPLTLKRIAVLGEQPDLIAQLQRYTCPFNMSGHPTLTFPAGMTRDGLPVGLQLIAGHFQEPILLRAGAAYQAATAWHRLHPPFPKLSATDCEKGAIA